MNQETYEKQKFNWQNPTMEFDLISKRNEFLMASLTLWPHILQHVNIDITVEKHVENLIGLLM